MKSPSYRFQPPRRRCGAGNQAIRRSNSQTVFLRGFTLIEMTVVLLIIAIVTHLAMRQLATRMDDRKTAAANRQLEEIRDSVFGCDRDGTPTGFLADMGRLVSATNGTLSELWRLPADAKPYAVLPATRENLVAGASSELINSNVLVATGWRGPYLRLPVGKSRLMDPWGNPMENPDASGCDRIGTNRSFAVVLSHFGPTALENDPCRRKIALTPAGGANSRLFVQLVSRANAIAETATVDYAWYGPASGRITGGSARASYGTVAELDGLTPGRRVIRVAWTPAEGSKKSLTRLVTVRPGDNQLQIEIP